MLTSDHKKDFLEGLKVGLTIIAGYLPYGIAYGILARQVGLSLMATLAMSLFVYAGTAQLIVVGMLQAAQSLSAIIATTFIVNVRYLLLCAVLVPFVSKWSWVERTVFGYYVSDETFAVLSSRYSPATFKKVTALTINFIGVIGWTISSFIGYIGSEMIPDTHAYGLDFALPAVFIGLLIMVIKNRFMLMVSLLSGILAVALQFVSSHGFEVLIATIIATTVGVFIARWKNIRLS